MTTTHQSPPAARGTRRNRHVPFSRKPRWRLYANAQRMGGDQIFSTRDSVLRDVEVLINTRVSSIFSEMNRIILDAGTAAPCQLVSNETSLAIARNANHVVAAWLDHLAIRVGPPVDFDLHELAAIAIDVAAIGAPTPCQWRLDLVETIPDLSTL